MNRVDFKLHSEKWLRTYCNKVADIPGYEETMEAIAESDGEYIHFDGSDASGDIIPEFWYHYEVVTGIKLDNPPVSFSCSC